MDSRKFSTGGFRWMLHVLRCPEHDLIIFRKCPSVCRSVGLSVLFCGHCISRTNGLKLMKLYIQLRLYVIWRWLDFGVYRSRRSSVIRNFWFLQRSDIAQNFVQSYLTRIILSQSLWNSNYLLIIAIVRSYIIFVYIGAIIPP